MRDEGAAVQLGTLYDCFAALPFWRMQPFQSVSDNAVALAEPGHVYVVYCPGGGKVSVDLGAVKGSLTARWLNPRTGQVGEVFEVAGSRSGQFQASDTNDWVLHLRAP